MADISLTASMRSNLLSLQNTQSLMDMTQERLSTGKKVNSAIDNPSSYYTSQSLTNRANDLSALLDSMGQGIQTIQAANEGIEAITAFAQQAKAIANSARDIASTYDQFAIGSNEITSPVIAEKVIIDSREDLSTIVLDLTGNAAAAKFDIYAGDDAPVTIDVKGQASAEAVATAVTTQLQKAGFDVQADADGTTLTIKALNGSDISWVNTEAGGATAGQIMGAGGSNAAAVVKLGADTGKNSASIAAALNTQGGVTAVVDGMGVEITAPDKEFRVFGGNEASQKALDAVGLSGKRKVGDPNLPNEDRADYAKQFNEILAQIDSLAKDSGYKGINLLQENNLTVIFNEDRSSNLEVKGVDASSEGLGLKSARNDWLKNSDIDSAISQVEDAVSRLRTMASEFGNNYSIIQNREDFTDNLINVLEEGSDKLVLADMNEESANMLALQTRQQLAINSLSLASQAAQSVLQLF